MNTAVDAASERMYARCLFCRERFPPNRQLAHMPRGHRIAFDPERGRLWVVCSGCHRWNLCPIEEREDAIYELERMARDHGRPLGHSANVTLLQAGPLNLVRIGRAGLVEQSWWRYGKELRMRRAAFESRRSRMAAYTLGAMAWMGELVGLGDSDLSIDWGDTPVADVQRWRRFGWSAWHGRETCPFCKSTLCALRYDLGWWVYPLRGEDGRLSVGVPCQRCDPWTPEKVYQLRGDAAENVLRRLLAYQNIGGASERRIVEAASAIEEAGSVGAFTAAVTERRQSLWKLGPTRAIGLEIALGESVEKRMLDLELGTLEFLWRQEEELARIIDEELTPRRLLEAHLRRLPIRIRPRRAHPTGADLRAHDLRIHDPAATPSVRPTKAAAR